MKTRWSTQYTESKESEVDPLPGWIWKVPQRNNQSCWGRRMRKQADEWRRVFLVCGCQIAKPTPKHQFNPFFSYATGEHFVKGRNGVGFCKLASENLCWGISLRPTVRYPWSLVHSPRYPPSFTSQVSQQHLGKRRKAAPSLGLGVLLLHFRFLVKF